MPINRFPFVRFMLLIVAIVLAGALVPATAQTKSSSQLKRDKQRIETEIANTQRLLKKTESNQKASLQQIAILRQQINNRERLITALNDEIMRLEEEQDLNQQMIANLQKKLEYMKADYAQVVYMACRNRRLMDKVTFILAADDFSQMFRRMRFYTVFFKNVKEQADKIKQTQLELQAKNEEIIALKNEKLTLLSGKETEIKKLELDRREKTRNAEQLKKKSQQLTKELKEKQAKRKELDAAIKRAIEAEIAAANKRKAHTSKGKGSAASTSSSSSSKSSATISLTPEETTLNTSFVNNKGRLPWPVAKGAKVGDYGHYAHPDVPSVTIENRGIDILTESGTAVRAVFDGVVSSIMDIMGTKVVMIRHGEFISVYQNLATVSVSKGSKVTTKQSIGTVAKNSTSNTYELHFEIWRNSSNLNPNEWLTRK